MEELLVDARRRLARASFAPVSREALLLLSRVLDLPEASILAHPDSPVDDDAVLRFEALLARRLRGEPMAYLLGEKEFYGRSFLVDPRVLVPRPETEHLVAAALSHLGTGDPTAPPPRILDLGTGSGCIAITLALELPRARVTATDVSLAALAVAATNRERHRAAVSLAAARTLDGVEVSAFDLVIANLPYLDPARVEGLALEVLRWEPTGALWGGAQGLDRFRDLLAAAPRLRPGARLLLEIGQDQADAVATIAAQYHLDRLGTLRDYAGLDRILVFER